MAFNSTVDVSIEAQLFAIFGIQKKKIVFFVITPSNILIINLTVADMSNALLERIQEHKQKKKILLYAC